MSKKKILMVCLGNICRSPVARGILNKKISENNIMALVDSCGTSNYHTGEKADKRSIENALKNNVDIRDHRARQFLINDFTEYDIIYVMDKSNYENVVKLASNKIEKDKVHLILNELENDSIIEVPDPYYGNQNGFQTVFDLLDGACNQIIKKIK